MCKLIWPMQISIAQEVHTPIEITEVITEEVDQTAQIEVVVALDQCANYVTELATQINSEMLAQM
uniref:Uncharacterized protein n=1 Tax=Cannabis sativa TaxID=3483 RepID=A0A803QUA9_CANSA